MNCLILDPSQQTQLATLNESGPPDRRLASIALTDSRRVLNADLLNDYAPGMTWKHYASFLATLPVESISIDLFPR